MSDLGTNIKYMFDKNRPGTSPGTTTLDRPSAETAPDRGAAEGTPLERLEAQICELAGHLAAATCRFLILLGDFDARRGWESWELTSSLA